MDDDNIDIEDVQQAQAQAAQDEQQQQQQQQQQAVVLLKKMILVLEQKETFPFQTRNKTDELVANFLENLEDDIHDMLCDNYTEAGNYRGLDSDRDTEAEVEAIVRFFPAVLTRSEEDEYPIQILAVAHNEDGDWQCNVKAVSFIPLLLRLAIEFGLFEEDERGGLLCEDVLHHLMDSDNTELELHNQEHHESVDTKYLQVLIQLRRLGVLKKEDIQRYGLLYRLCIEDHFAEKRFRFIVEWDPSALTQTNENGWLPIHYASEESSIRGLELVFEYGIRYFPKKKGISLLFKKKKNHDGSTSFQYACMKFGEKQMIKMIEDTFIRCYSSLDDTPPLNVVEALMTAAIDEDIHLDCVYFLLRRQPDILQKLLSSASSTMIATSAADMVEFNSNNNGISPKKRKRKDTNIGDDGGTI
ncbi:hypothetical protein FRACYDRAFT_244031 [Fragilariopsis cylindrus CCMP1102]|uniref:Ankyrin n=1 Tax=Fragilariopsis cylindrus CCMP1102 TaxID=635003 RepID=A0A1E7F3I7_9STRA|nr:hypothetical protein FRACYDRAFT_244031 [Fragilariopsis cylindrus CCMP1102]|eukprot:OEU12758.1 hypothetical protein FRACYDRAFT_244031 [Fragilariopsis cylindrus CCMP1102]